MSAIAPIIFVILVLAALVAWFFAITAAFSVWGASPPGEKFSNYMRLGMLQFGNLESRLGPPIRPVLRRYRYGLLGFLACIIVAIAVSFISIALSS